MQNKTFSIVIPAYNEEDRAADTIPEIANTFNVIALLAMRQQLQTMAQATIHTISLLG